MKIEKNLQVYNSHMNMLQMQPKTAAPFFTMIFFGSLILANILTTLIIAPYIGFGSLISFMVSVVIANVALFLAAIAYYFMTKDKAEVY